MNSLEKDADGLNRTARREFLKQCAIAVSGIALMGSLPMLESCSSSTEPAISHGTTKINVAGLTQDGTSLVVSNTMPDGSPILVIRKSATSYLALSTKCTHMGCTVDPPQNGVISCPCHGSQYDLSGNVIQGPAPNSLRKYDAQFDTGSHTLNVTY